MPGELGAVADGDVAGKDAGTADDAVFAEGDGACDDGGAGDDGVVADDDVVADLDLVVEFDAVADDGVAHGAAVDGGAGADFDVIANAHAAQLGDRQPAAVFEVVAEAAFADDGVGEYLHARAGGGACEQARACADVAVCADAHAGGDVGERFDAATVADVGARTDDGTRANGNVCANGCGGVNVRLWRDGGRWQLRGEAGGEFAPGAFDVGDDDLGGAAFGAGLCEEDGGECGVGEVFAVVGLAQEANFAGLAVLQGAGAVNGGGGVADEGAAEAGGDVACGLVHGFSALRWRRVMTCGLRSARSLT